MADNRAPAMARGPMGGPGRHRGSGEKAKDLGGTLRRLVSYARPHIAALVLALLFAVASVAFNVVGPDVLGRITTKLFEGLVAKVGGTGGIDFAWIGRTALFLLGLYLASAGCSAVQGILLTGVSQKVCYRLRSDIAERISQVPLGYFDDHSKGDVLSRITNDVDTLGASLNQSLSQMVTSVTQVVGVAAMMVSISPVMAGVTFLCLPLALVVVLVVVHFSQRYFVQQQRTLGAVNGIVEEDFAGQMVIQAFSRRQASVEEFDAANEGLYDSAWRSQFLSGLMQPLMNLVSNMGYVGVVVVGAGLAAAGTISIGDIQAFMQYVRNFTQPISQLANVGNMLQSMAAAAERVFEFLDAPVESEPEHPERPASRDGSVAFDDVVFGYKADEPVIRGLSFSADPGQTVAIVGPTGAGKSTLMKLMLRFYDVDGGRVRVDGLDVRRWSRPDLRGNFAMVLQDSWLFKGTVRENIRFGRLDATDEEVEEAARVARCDHFVNTLDGGYDFMVNEEGTNLSQGQRQLVTIARAVLADRPILILDEATSNVDTRTEVLIQEAMDRLMAGRTSFVVAHRLSTIRNADNILVMEHGDVVEQGTHRELLAKDGVYARLYNSQFEGCD
ncbi:ABC transporter [Granulimonas faecalis]|uniref:Fatty acid ABC transporter ATP-binding/permease protein n=1 Tax=Granulimonas faecalis TaxID=2894155 RepID=A0AAV5B3Q5_9ACTN|nr:ABC transporter ATP-binding protein [Granulimonas faecalis]GJM55241.1 ABC transporter [Granulimonas faecalis]